MRRSIRLLALILGAGLCALGCGDDDQGADDTSDGAVDTGFLGDLGAGDRASAVESTCLGTPPGSPVPQKETNTGRSIHWSLADGCIPFTHDAELADEVEDLRSVVNVWNQIECSELCFTPPRQSYASSAADVTGILVTVDGAFAGHPDGLDPYQSSQTSYHFDTDGSISRAIILVEPAPRDRDLDQILVSAIARGAGLELEGHLEIINTLPLSLEEDIETAVCLMYGDPPYCLD